MIDQFFEIDLDRYKQEVLPSRITICAGRKKPIILTPEEIVRQALINYLTEEKGYPIDRIHIEVHMSTFRKDAVGRADIIISDDDGYPICIIECKKDGEHITDNVIGQIWGYNDVVGSNSICIVAGNKILFCAFDEEDKVFCLKEFPFYQNLLAFNFQDVFDSVYEPFINLATSQSSYKFLQEHAILGIDTNPIYFPFLVKFYNFLNSEEEIQFNTEPIKDLRMKFTKFGNSSGGGYPGDYRSFVNDTENSVISLSISSSWRGEGHPTHTIILFAVEDKIEGKSTNHISLQLRVDKYIELAANDASFWHDGTITLGKQGAGKKQELLDFVFAHNPNLIKDGKIFLGTLNFENEIDTEDSATNKFLINSIAYAIIRDKFRKFKKSIK